MMKYLYELEESYHVLCIINQFFDQPFKMPTPRECISEICYDLAITLLRKETPDQFIRKALFQNHPVLIRLMTEIESFIELEEEQSNSME